MPTVEPAYPKPKFFSVFNPSGSRRVLAGPTHAAETCANVPSPRRISRALPATLPRLAHAARLPAEMAERKGRKGRGNGQLRGAEMANCAEWELRLDRGALTTMVVGC
jgi:hypothetical protein